MSEDYEPSLKNVLDQKSLKWVFVGGKGGVGKTTTSCCLAVQLAKVRRNVLLVSTDPAHNLSDAFGQKFGRTPTAVRGFENLFAMEIDPTVEASEEIVSMDESAKSLESGFSDFLKKFSGNIPGIDELVSFAELMRHVQRLEFDVTVFDTAPTGHTLRLLSLPGMIENVLEKALSYKDVVGPMMNTVKSFAGGETGLPDIEEIVTKLEEMQKVIDAVQVRIHSPDETTFVCVCIPEFLSIYETERLVQELAKFDIDTHNIVVNQILFPNADGNTDCKRCATRIKMQNKYLDQIGDLYEDFHVVKTPLLDDEVRGSAKLEAFGRYLVEPYNPVVPLPEILKAPEHK